MQNLVDITYSQTGASSNTDEMGMREMQRKAYAARHHQYILLKAPPASGKSRALMFLALDKTEKQGLRKTIVAVPEKTIGKSFQNTDLKKYGFFADWRISPYYNLCDADNEKDKTKRFKEFLDDPTAKSLVCTHSTLRNALTQIDNSKLNNSLLAIDEFHHVSADANNMLGDNIHRIMTETSAHIVAMTGSYFRGDAVPVLRAEDENRFYSVTYNYYQQLNGYRYLKSLGIGYAFYTGKYLNALHEALDTTKKTLIHIPSVNSRASTGDKYDEVDRIVKTIGEVIDTDYERRTMKVKTPDGRILIVADLVEDDSKDRQRLQSYLQRMYKRDDMDIIIALGTAKEGFDWEWCERCLTIGVRGSLTEVVQIIGRCTRDCEGKERAEFVNLIACPDTTQKNVEVAVNDMLKAISASLLMEQVLAPQWNFKTKKDEAEDDSPYTIVVEGLKPLSSERTKHIIESDMNELIATLYNSNMIQNAIGDGVAPEVVTQVLMPKVIQEKYPDLSQDEVEEIRQRLVLETNTKGAEIEMRSDGSRFMKIGSTFVNIDELNINLIDSVNPFQRAYEILSKSVTAEILKTIQTVIEEKRIDMDVAEAVTLFKNHVPKYMAEHSGKMPEITDSDPFVKRLAQAIAFIARKKQEAITQKSK
ncbi:MAG: DEAD/DEAH box helicase family protein [Oscillospiraceae bacterium]